MTRKKEQLLTVKNLAEYLQVSERTVYRLIKRREIPHIKIGNQWRFKKQMIDEWLEKEQFIPRPRKEDTA
ncbi:helix-turn-helix domain-containing protein [Candidatus Sumerlaeota bacterium]|nr:helix-turn-helix domain-containing protein [Candidatus Sumerlaeota bacterium]